MIISLQIMIEVVANLHTPVCLASERVSCTITFTNHGETEETIAWAGAQVHCQACFREDVVKVDPTQIHSISPGPSTDTTFIPNRGTYMCIHILFILGEGIFIIHWGKGTVQRSRCLFLTPQKRH